MSYSPAALLGDMGIPVLTVWLRDTWALWSPVHRKIVVAAGLSPIQLRCVLAHELEHVLADDVACGFGVLTADRERRADIEAARKLIAISDLSAVAQQGVGIDGAALRLDVTQRMLMVRLDDLQGEGWPWPGMSKIAG
jgi:hypothetical protein